MTVVASAVPQIRQLAQQRYLAPNLALPISIWASEIETLGDGTGGVVLISVNGGAASPKYAWSLEDTEIAINSAVVVTGESSWTIGDINLAGGATVHRWAFTTVLLPAGLGSFRTVSMQSAGNPSNAGAPPRRLNWGRPGAATFMGHSCTFPNVLAEASKLYAWGYMWDRSILDDGSIPVRP